MQRIIRPLLNSFQLYTSRAHQQQQCGIRLPAHIAATLDNSGESPKRQLDQSDAIAVSNCGGFVLCWHPSKRQPYDSTLPMPAESSSVAESESLSAAPLKPSLVRLADNRERFGPTLDDLTAVFHKPMPFFRPFPQKTKRARPYEYADDQSERTPRRGL
ncbi:hypothetical protein BOX15_Mlig019643g2 [Macrostomum lignano]|uniref:Uncharacterized protein n=1 Tax=Macrostomum lignano TaxID=282301 RepID=A0A267F1P5_9PLAT|nr:hypothetical protein BOX15_Mlig019643g2 [Macrostomum lignano]